MIGGLDWPSSGTILVDGEQIDQMDENQLANYRRDKLGFIFQTFNLISNITAEDNIGFPLRFSGVKRAKRLQIARELMEKVGLTERCGHKPIELSGGQQQRVAVARAVVGDPSIVLADEPTGNLDSTNSEAVMALLAGLHRDGATICMVTHDPRYARHASRTVHLFDGRIVEEEEAARREQEARELNKSGFDVV